MNELPIVRREDANFNRRIPVCILLDTSGSMEPHSDALHAAFEQLISDLKADSVAVKSADLAIIGFGDNNARILREFSTIRELSSTPRIDYDGCTPLGKGLEAALELLCERQAAYIEQGIPQYKPLIVVFSDGMPTDSWSASALKFSKQADAKGWNVFALAFGQADTQVLGTVAKHVLQTTKNFRFTEFFRWISSSVASVSRSVEGDKVKIELPPGVIQIKV